MANKGRKNGKENIDKSVGISYIRDTESKENIQRKQPR